MRFSPRPSRYPAAPRHGTRSQRLEPRSDVRADNSSVQIWRPSPALRSVAVLFAIGSILFAIWIVGEAAGEGALAQGVGFAAFLVLPPAAIGLRYALRTRIEVATDSLVVITTFSKRTFEWRDIRDAEPGYAGITLLLDGGQTFVAGAVQKSNASRWLGRRTRADELAEIIKRRARADG